VGRELFPFLKGLLELWIECGMRAAENIGKKEAKCYFYLLRNCYFEMAWNKAKLCSVV
jgi:hypothetical protein